jgi:hypothetical protein
VDLEHEQGDDDREDAVAQGKDPRGVVRAFVTLPCSFLVHPVLEPPFTSSTA